MFARCTAVEPADTTLLKIKPSRFAHPKNSSLILSNSSIWFSSIRNHNSSFLLQFLIFCVFITQQAKNSTLFLKLGVLWMTRKKRLIIPIFFIYKTLCRTQWKMNSSVPDFRKCDIKKSSTNTQRKTDEKRSNTCILKDFFFQSQLNP